MLIVFPHCTASRREIQKDSETVPPKSSPKRFAVVSPKPQSPGEFHTLTYTTLQCTVCVHVNTHCIH